MITREQFITNIESEGFWRRTDRPLKNREYIWICDDEDIEWQIFRTFARKIKWVNHKPVETEKVEFDDETKS